MRCLADVIHIAIKYDNYYKFRYFIYEVSDGLEAMRVQYSINEICSDGEKINYGLHYNMEKEAFKDELVDILFYELL